DPRRRLLLPGLAPDPERPGGRRRGHRRARRLRHLPLRLPAAPVRSGGPAPHDLPDVLVPPLGGTETVAGTSISGAQNIFFAQLADPEHSGLYTEGTKYFAGRFATMMFGLPGACLAMYHCVPKGRRAKLMGLFLGVADRKSV